MNPDKVARLSAKTYGEIVRLYGKDSEAVKELRVAIREHVIQRIILAQQLTQRVSIMLVTSLANFLQQATLFGPNLIDEFNEGDLRSAVSRFYYAFYHMARAVCFEKYGRDEDSHEKLPKLLEKISYFKARGYHERLNELRLRRNECDYSPYLIDPRDRSKSTSPLGPEATKRRLWDWTNDAFALTSNMQQDSIAWLKERGYDFSEE